MILPPDEKAADDRKVQGTPPSQQPSSLTTSTSDVSKCAQFSFYRACPFFVRSSVRLCAAIFTPQRSAPESSNVDRSAAAAALVDLTLILPKSIQDAGEAGYDGDDESRYNEVLREYDGSSFHDSSFHDSASNDSSSHGSTSDNSSSHNSASEDRSLHGNCCSGHSSGSDQEVILRSCLI